MQINFSISGFEKLVSAFERFPMEATRGLKDVVNRVAVFLEAETKMNITKGTRMWKSPIDTGAMRRGIYAQSGNGVAYVRPSSITSYATYVHEGTSRMKKRPFFEITVEESKKSVEDFASAEVEKLVNKIFK